MKQIAILHYTVPPLLDEVSNLIYYHIYYLIQEDYLLRLIAGSGDESYFEASFHHQIEFYPIPEISPTSPEALEVIRSLEMGQAHPLFNEYRDQLASRLQPLLADASLCIAHNAITSTKNLPLTAALHQLHLHGVTRFIAWRHDTTEQEASLPAGYPWDLVRSAWPGVRYVAGSRGGAEMLGRQVGLPARDVAVIPQGIDAAAFLEWEETTVRLVESLDLLGADPLLLVPSTLAPQANLELAVRAAAALAQDHPGAVLLASGSRGQKTNLAYLDSLRALAATLGIEKNVVFLVDHVGQSAPGRVPEAVQADLIRLADLLLLPAFEESSAAPLLGAALARLPILAADIPFFREYAGSSARFFDPNGSVAALAGEIDAALRQDPALPARQRVQRKLTWEAIMKNALIPLIKETAK